MSLKEAKDNLMNTIKKLTEEINLVQSSSERLVTKTEKIKELSERKNKAILALEQLKRVK